MPAVVLNGQLSTGHGCFPPTSVSATSTKTTINGKKVALNGDIYGGHSCGRSTHPPHPGTSGASKTTIDGRKPLRIGDSLSCGDTCGQGSSNTFVE